MALRKLEMEGKNTVKKTKKERDKGSDMETNIQQTYFLSLIMEKKDLTWHTMYHPPPNWQRICKKIYPQEGVEVGR